MIAVIVVMIAMVIITMIVIMFITMIAMVIIMMIAVIIVMMTNADFSPNYLELKKQFNHLEVLVVNRHQQSRPACQEIVK